jgi:hypothetical protein
VSQALSWSTLRPLEGSFVDEDLRASEVDFLYQIEHVSGEDSVWLYVLLEHQSTPDRWMRFRLLKYCCRIWDMSFREYPDQRELRAIAPLVFYQGERSWSYSSEFADLFAESVREWPGVPRFSHGLIDQSGIEPGEVQGGLKVRLMQLPQRVRHHLHRKSVSCMWRTQTISSGMAQTRERCTGGTGRATVRTAMPGAQVGKPCASIESLDLWGKSATLPVRSEYPVTHCGQHCPGASRAMSACANYQMESRRSTRDLSADTARAHQAGILTLGHLAERALPLIFQHILPASPLSNPLAACVCQHFLHIPAPFSRASGAQPPNSR